MAFSSNSSSGGGKSLLHLLPVDDLPDLLQEFGSRVLIVEIVSVLPDIHVQKWSVSTWANSILVRGGQDLELLGLLTEVRPRWTGQELVVSSRFQGDPNVGKSPFA